MSKLKMITDGKGGGYIEGGDPATTVPSVWQLLLDEIKPHKVLDVGCAEGHAMHWFVDHGAIVEGCDYSATALKHAPGNAYQHDIEAGPYHARHTPDMVWCAEVVEHIDPAKIDFLLDTLCQAEYVCLTHAVKGQGGHHHVNCQDSGYWVARMRARGYLLDRRLTDLTVEAAKQDGFNFWARSGMVFRRDSGEPLDLVLTVADGYDWYALKPFVRSLNRTGFRGDLVVFVDHTDRDTLRQLERFGAWLIPCSAKPPYAAITQPDDSKYGELRPVYYRFLLYQRFLEQNRGYRRVLMADSRDIFFFDDPFEGIQIEPDTLHVFREAVTIQDCPYNSDWIQRAFGQPMVKKIGELPVYCAGALIGGDIACRQFSKTIVEHIDVFRPGVKMRGLDQAALNVLLFDGRLEATTHEFGEGPVLHAGYLPKNRPIFPKERGLVHQYDRNHALRRRVNDVCDQW